MITRAFVAGAAAVGLVLAASGVRAEPIKCQRDLAKASAKYVQGRTKAIDKCEQNKVKGKVPPATDCPSDPKVSASLVKLGTSLASGIAKSCGGADKVCGAGGDDDSLASIGWDIGNCPDFESSGCTNAIANCADIATCLQCIHDAAVDQAIALYYASLQSSEFGSNSPVNKCQQAIGKETSKFLQARSKALQKCWDARLKGQHAMTCPADATGKTALAIQKAEDKKVANICKACGGADKLCDGNGDVTPAQIGFASSCPAVVPFASPSCSASISNADAIVDCVDCVTEFKTDCMDAVAVPDLVSPLPPNCNGGAPTTTSTTTPGPTTTSTPGPTSSTSTSAPTPTTSSTSTSTTTSSTSTTGGATATAFDFLSTAGTGACGNTFRGIGGTVPLKSLNCGQLSLGGGFSQVPDNTTPPGATNRFSLSCVGASCTVGPLSPSTAAYDCTAVGCFFGTPLPISNAGLSVCVTNTFSPTAPSGTLNTGTGAITLNFQLNSATVLTGTPLQPCPICKTAVGGTAGSNPCVGSPGAPCTGVCDGSPNQGAACTSKNPNGLTSGCPSPAATPAQQKCYRGTNNNGNCSSGADCPGGLCAQFIGDIPISLNPLTTGTASLTGTFDNALCTGASAPQACCTGAGVGNCNTFCPGQTASQKGAFRSDICRTGANSGAPCVSTNPGGESADALNCGAGALCRSGTLNNYCIGGTNSGKGCVTNTNCGSGVACTGGPGQGTCAAGETCTGSVCVGAANTCIRAGTIVQHIREVGAPTGALSIGVPKNVKLGSAFCVGATTNGTVNGNASLPGPGATGIVGTVTLVP